MPSYGDAVLADEPIAYWRFGEADTDTKLRDEVARQPLNRVGTPTRIAKPAGGYALTGFSATNYGLWDIPENAGTAWTVEGWINRGSGNGGGLWGSRGPTEHGFDIQVDHGNNRISVEFGDGGAWLVLQNILGIQFTADTWHHLAITVGAGAYRVYKDGVDVAGGTYTGNARLTSPFSGHKWHVGRIGTNANAGTAFWSGSIGDMALYDKVLTAAQIAAHYAGDQAGAVTPPTLKAYALTVADDTPLGHWRLGETSGAFASATGTGRDLTLNGTGITRGVTGLLTGDADKAITLSGDNATYLRAAYASWMNSAAMTAEAWIKTSRATGHQMVLDRDDGNLNRVFQFRINAGKPEVIVFLNSSTLTTVTGPASIADGATHHLAATYDGIGVRLYVDGVVVAVTAFGGTLHQPGAGPLTAAGSTFNYPVFGTQDETALYGTALRTKRIYRHYLTGTTALTTPPSNDSPTSSTTLTTDTTTTTDTSGATTDPLEPAAGGTSSAWYTVTAGSNDPLLIDTTESNYATSVAVYEGTVNTSVQDYNLTLVASGDGSVAFKPVSGKTYTVKVGSKTSGTSGTQKVKQSLSVMLGYWGFPI